MSYSSNSKVVGYLTIRDTQTKWPYYLDNQCVFNLIKQPSYDLNERIASCRSKNDRVIYVVGDSHAINLFHMLGYSEKFSTVVGLTQGGCRPHGCGKTNHYKYFKEKILPLVKFEDVIIFHQSGSYLVADRNGKNDSQRTFNEGVYSVDYDNIKKLESF